MTTARHHPRGFDHVALCDSYIALRRSGMTSGEVRDEMGLKESTRAYFESHYIAELGGESGSPTNDDDRHVADVLREGGFPRRVTHWIKGARVTFEVGPDGRPWSGRISSRKRRAAA